jgi:hypothetical protein
MLLEGAPVLKGDNPAVGQQLAEALSAEQDAEFTAAQYSEIYKQCIEIEQPKFTATVNAASYLPQELIVKLPELGDQYHPVGLSAVAVRNVLHFGKIVDKLRPGERLSVLVDKLSSFRSGGGYSRMPYPLERSSTTSNDKGLNSLKKGEFTGVGISINGVASTSDDGYEAVIKELGISDAPTFKEMLANGLRCPTTSESYSYSKGFQYIVDGEDATGYRSRGFTTQTGLAAFFYMQGVMVGRQAPEVNYDLGVCVYSTPQGELVGPT